MFHSMLNLDQKQQPTASLTPCDEGNHDEVANLSL